MASDRVLACWRSEHIVLHRFLVFVFQVGKLGLGTLDTHECNDIQHFEPSSALPNVADRGDLIEPKLMPGSP